MSDLLRPITKARLRFLFFVARYPLNRLPALTGWSGSAIRTGLVRWRLRRDSDDDAEWSAVAGKQVRRALALPFNPHTVGYACGLVAQGQRRLRHQADRQTIPWSVIDKAGSDRERAEYLIAHMSVPHQAPARSWFCGWTADETAAVDSPPRLAT